MCVCAIKVLATEVVTNPLQPFSMTTETVVPIATSADSSQLSEKDKDTCCCCCCCF